MKKFLMPLGLAVLLSQTGCHSTDKEEKEDAIYQVTSPIVKDTTVVNDYVCQIRSIQHIEIRALEKGYLQKIYVDEGQFVKKGQLMFQIMPFIYDAEFERAKAEANFAEIEYRNTKALADSNIVSKNELAMSKAKYDKAKAEMNLAKVNLGFTEIRAPFDGIMDRFQVRLGSLVDEGDLLTSLSDNSKMWVYFNVPEAEYLDFRAQHKNNKDMDVQLLMANNKVFDQKGVVETIEADFNNETGNIAFRATFPNPDKLLRHGETGSVLVTIPLKNALIIPQKASLEILEKQYVYVVDKDNVIHLRPITVGATLQDLFVVTAGLKKGDRILLEGIRKVDDNDKIKVKFIAPEQIIKNLKLYAE